MNRAGLEVRDLTYGYKGYDRVLQGMGFTAEGGELISLLGRNGAGKSTLFKCVLGLIRDYEGSVEIGGEDMKTVSARELAKKVAYIPQSHYPSFNYSVLDMVLMGSANQLSSLGSPKARQKELALAALERTGILHLAARGFAQISGGEQQLVLMARAILQNAGIWILDEPLASLDYGNQIRVLKQLKSLASEGYLILQSIHNPDQAYRYSDRVLGMSAGKLICDGKPEEVLNTELVHALYGEDADWKPAR